MKKKTPGSVIMGFNPELLVNAQSHVRGTKHKNATLPNWKSSLARILGERNKFNADGTTASFATQDKYADVLFAGFNTLQEKGYKLNDAEGFRGKHMEILAKHWQQQYLAGKLSPSTIQGRFSIFRVFAGWIGKQGMVEGSFKYIIPEAITRTSLCTTDKSWRAQDINPETKLDQVTARDERVGLQLRLELAFGLRGKEAMMLRPYLADKGAYLDVSVGTKGGRPRAVPIKTAEQRALLDKAKTFAATKDSSTSDPNRSLAQWKNHYYYVLRRCGISRKNGLTAHGLRHAYANNRYQELSGKISPVRGGKLGNREDDRFTRIQVAEELGHSRESITTHYLGRDKGKS